MELNGSAQNPRYDAQGLQQGEWRGAAVAPRHGGKTGSIQEESTLQMAEAHRREAQAASVERATVSIAYTPELHERVGGNKLNLDLPH